MSGRPKLSIAIPTYKRAAFLALTLAQLRQEIASVAPGAVEVVVSDNCSPDETPAVVAAAIDAGLPIRSIRNDSNIGSDRNIAQVFNLARGEYVLILGDDDLFVDGALATLLARLSERTYGVVCLRPYGYVNDFRREYPGGAGPDRLFTDCASFLCAIGEYLTLISACVINKRLIDDVEAGHFVGGNLTQVHLGLAAALAASHNLYVTRYSVACKRNNSGGYEFWRVFADELWDILDAYRGPKLPASGIRAVQTRYIFRFYPFYLLRERRDGGPGVEDARKRLRARFGDRMLFWVWLAPILFGPRPLALAWGAFTTFVGRGLTGDLRRGLAFAFRGRSAGVAARRPAP
jgi:abequosyltransferase